MSNIHASGVRRAWKKHLHGLPNVQGSAVGFRYTGGKRTDETAVVVYVGKKVPLGELGEKERVPSTVDGVPTDVKVANFKTLEDPSLYRPAPPGCSIGHRDITAGTLGMVMERNGRVVVLSNNHVMANSNAGAIGDPILQPGPYDGGKLPIALLSDFVEIYLQGGGLPGGCSIPGVGALIRPNADDSRNLVDAALAYEYESGILTREVLEIGTINPNPVAAELGMPLHKRGRTTQHTHGVVTALDADVQVSGYGGTGVALFEEQIVTDVGSAGGDSGSLVVTENGNSPVGLLFAGGEGQTIINNIFHVLEAFPGLRFV